MHTPSPPTYDRQVIAAWLHGYTTGHDVGWHVGRAAGFTEGYDVGHADGIPAGRDQADREAAARWRAYRAMSDAVRPNTARPRPWVETKPLLSAAECLASWHTTTAGRAPRPAA